MYKTFTCQGKFYSRYYIYLNFLSKGVANHLPQMCDGVLIFIHSPTCENVVSLTVSLRHFY